jgi:hypothetical protein
MCRLHNTIYRPNVTVVLQSFAAPGNVCPESVIQVIGRHPDTVDDNGRNKSLCHALTRDQQHDIGTKDHPAPVDQSLDKSSCSSFHLTV